MRISLSFILALSVSTSSYGGLLNTDSAKNDTVVVRYVHSQTSFGSSVPVGNYSGIVWLGNSRYAVVSDKSVTDGFFIFDIDIDSISGKIKHVENNGFLSASAANRDQEGITYVRSRKKIYISGESDNRVLEYNLDGTYTGRYMNIPSEFASAGQSYGIESLTYNDSTNRFWLTTESTLPCDGQRSTYNLPVKNILRLQCFNDSLQPLGLYYYEMDKPTVRKTPGKYAFGVSDICALDDGQLLVMEREFFVARHKLGSWVNIKIFIVDPNESLAGKFLPKSKVLEFRTSLSLLKYDLANYEGMCLGPRLVDGSRVLLLVSDSQNRYGGVLKDYFKTIILRIGQ